MGELGTEREGFEGDWRLDRGWPVSGKQVQEFEARTCTSPAGTGAVRRFWGFADSWCLRALGEDGG